MKQVLLPLISSRSGWVFRQLLKGISIVSASLTTWLIAQGVDAHTTAAIVAGISAALSWGAELGLSKLARHIAVPCLALCCLVLASCGTTATGERTFAGITGKGWLEVGKSAAVAAAPTALDQYGKASAKTAAKQPVNVQPSPLPDTAPASEAGWLNSLLNLF